MQQCEPIKQFGRCNAGNKVFVQSSLRLSSTQKQGSSFALHLAFVFWSLAPGFLTAVLFVAFERKEKPAAARQKQQTTALVRLAYGSRWHRQPHGCLFLVGTGFHSQRLAVTLTFRSKPRADSLFFGRRKGKRKAPTARNRPKTPETNWLCRLVASAQWKAKDH